MIEKYLETPGSSDGNLPIIVNLDPWGFPADNSSKCSGDYSLVDGSVVGFRSFGKLREAFATWLNERTGGTKTIRRGAVLIRNSRTSAEWLVINAKLKPTRFSVSGYWKSRIEQVSSKTSRPIYWVVGPCSSHWGKLFEGRQGLDDFCSWLAGIPRQKVVNLYSLPCGDELFADPTHLNMSGAKDLSLRMCQYIKDASGI